MIKAGDKVSIFVPGLDDWFEGTVVLIYPKTRYESTSTTYYVNPNDPFLLKGHCRQLSDSTGLANLSSLDYELISNIEDYGEAQVKIISDKNHIKLISGGRIYSNKSPCDDGCKCKQCQQFIQYAEPNQVDNTFLCYSCKSNPMRQYY